MFKPRLKFTLPALLPALALVCLQTTLRAQAPAFSQLIIFGDSLSDTGNDADVTNDAFGESYPGNTFNYANGRFTDDAGTKPAAVLYKGVWHEQLATLFLGMKAADPSLDGGTDFAYGDAETLDGQRDISITTGVDVHIDNMGRQVSTYLDGLNGSKADAAALFIVWGGANDLFDDASGENVIAAAQRETALIQMLAEAGAATFLVPNVPPLGYTPNYNTDAATMTAYNEVSSNFRDALNGDLDALETTLAGEGLTVKIYRLDVYSLFLRLVANPAAYGFTDYKNMSQDGSDPDHHLFWDDVHPTTAGHFQLAAEAYTVLSGIPVVEINPILDNSGFYLTRTGTDLSGKLKVHFGLGGSAVNGVDYEPLYDVKKLRPNKQTVTIPVTPTATGNAGGKVKIKLLADPAYVLPVVQQVSIKLP